MKVLIITNYPAPYKVKLFQLLGEKCELTVIYEQSTEEQKHRDSIWFIKEQCNFREIYLKEKKYLFGIRCDKSIKKYLLSKKYDFIINYEYSSFTGIYSSYIMKKHHIAYLLAADGAVIMPCNIIKKWIKTWEIKGADYCLSPCELTNQYFLHFGADRQKLLRYISTPIGKADVAEDILSGDQKLLLRDELNIKEQYSLFAACRFVRVKGLDIILELANRMHNVGFYIAGTNHPDEFTKAALMRGIPDNVHILGFLNNDQMKKYYKACNALLITTRFDAWPSVLLEAMAQGQPVISSDMAVYAHKFIRQGQNGFMVRSEDINGFQKAIQEAFSMDLSLMGKSALDTVKNYTIENSSVRYMELLNQLKYSYKIVVAHPGRQHSYRLAAALKKGDMNLRYITTVYNKKASVPMKLVKYFLKAGDRKRADSRRCNALKDSEVIQQYELSGLFLLWLLRVNKGGSLYQRYSAYHSRIFQKAVAKYAIKNHTDLIIMYDAAAKNCFEILKEKAPEIIRVMDHAQAPRYYLYQVYSTKKDAWKEFAQTFDQKGYVLNEKKALYDKEEALLAHYHIVASGFSAEGLYYYGIPKDKIFIIPYGVDSLRFSCSKNPYDKLRVLFVGDINQRKGIGQILKAAKDIDRPDIEFTLVGGGYEKYHELFEPYKKYVNFAGSVVFERMIEYYRNCNLFIFPVMGEGFGLVILEALSAGLPVICTRNCAGADLIREGINGFLIDVGDDKALADRIVWFRNNPQQLEMMSTNARDTALEYSWEKYEQNIIASVHTILRKGKESTCAD